MELNEDGTPKLSKSAQKKLAKQATSEPKKDKTLLKAAWGAPKEGKDDKKKSVIPKFEYVNTTPKGEKKDLKSEMMEAYQPAAVEAAWQDWWEKSGFYSCTPSFAAGKDPAVDKFVMVIPPPNVTGSLHLGHALTAAVEDCLTRWHRMQGHATMYVPGTDHAGIATQSVVEKMMAKTEGKTRHEIGRDAFLEKVWEWKQEYGNRITSQLRYLGSSCDWSRERFTMDDMCSKAVVEAFNRFHEAGILYRDRRLGNWSCALKSAISDIEVDTLELEGRTFLSVPNHKGNPSDPSGKYEFGVITSFAYPVDGDGSEEVVVATTRLETMLGDTAVAIHPDDPRYTHLHGKFVVHPFDGRKIPIILDAVLVDMTKGTGAVKVTPAHDPHDYETGKRHGLPFLTMLNEDGSINDLGGDEFKGLMRYDARIKMEEALKAKGLFRGKAPNKMNLGICSRSGDILEPMITPQWYVSCDNMAKRACDAVRSGELKIEPKEHEKTWFQWLENIRDWCVSRQLWWGHRIPAWFATKKDEVNVSRVDMKNNDRWIVARSEAEARVKAAKLLGVPEADVNLSQDEDVLDTWFSSGLFPFSVFGWPENTPDFNAFYPTSLLETGVDILFFWVARMVMMGLQLTDQLPFHTVYLHAMVRDKSGRKMSKSLGNVIDPLEVILGCSLEVLHSKIDGGNLPKKEIERAKKDQEADFPDGIPECGSDALRFGLLAYTVQGRDVNLDIKRIVAYRQFCNKLWNATRFALQFVADFSPSEDMAAVALKSGKLKLRDLWMMSRINAAAGQANAQLAAYEFGAAQQTLYSFWLYEICDIYLEVIKPVVYDMSEANKDDRWASQATLWAALETGLRLLHPMMPFVTEELWQRLPGRGTLGSSEPVSIMLAEYPQFREAMHFPAVEKNMSIVMSAVRSCRNLKTQYNIPNKERPAFFLSCGDSSISSACSGQTFDIDTLAKGSVTVLLGGGGGDSGAPSSAAVEVVDATLTCYMDLKGMVDYGAEIKRLEKDKSKVKASLDAQQRQVQAAGYEQNVAEDVKKTHSENIAGFEKRLDEITKAMANFEKLCLEDGKAA